MSEPFTPKTASEVASNDVNPFTPDVVREILQKAIKETANTPRPSQSSIEDLAWHLSCINRYALADKQLLTTEKDTEAIHKAIEVLIALLPEKRRPYLEVAEVAAVFADEARDAALVKASLQARKDLAAIDGLIAALDVMKKRELPNDIGLPVSIPTNPTYQWHEIAPWIQNAFHSCLSGQSKDAGYRFVAKVVPYGEKPTDGAVKIEVLTRVKNTR
jgi:hypothetical protein